MRFAKKMTALVLLAVLAVGLFGNIPTDAKEITIATPKISIKAAKNETGIKVTIGKSKFAEGYEIYVTFEADNSLYTDGENAYCYDNFSCKDKLARTVELSGAKKRTVTVKAEELVTKFISPNNANCKTLPAGKYTIKVRSYNKKKFSATRYSEFSKSKTLTIKKKKTGSGYNSSYDFSGVKKGDVITFGAYEQDGNFYNGQEPIEWVVLKKTKSQVFVVSKYALDRLPYNKECKEVTWETCTLRKWLNGKFYNAAFNKTEKGMIKTTTVENYDNAVYNIPGGDDTKDKVFLLSQLEVIESDYGFADTYDEYDVKRRCAPSGYAIARGTYVYTENNEVVKTADGLGAGYWWLRSPGGLGAYYACRVLGSGYVDSDGGRVDNDYYYGFAFGVRSALVLNLKS